MRQKNLKVLAAQADARWAAQPSFLDKPGRERGQPLPALGGMQLGGGVRSTLEAKVDGMRSAVGGSLGEGEGLKEAESPQDAAKLEIGWNGEVRAQAPMPAVEETPKKEEEVDMQVPHHKKHYFNERLDGSKVKEKKYKEDPWKQARGAPSEEWQPQAWSPNVAATRR
jgi:NADH dehydrogenase [ubiquinone] 1 alpha subcomplex assembly factor 2